MPRWKLRWRARMHNAQEPGAPIRVLFVFATLEMRGEENAVRLLAEAVSPSKLKLDMVVCFLSEGLAVPDYRELEALGIDVDTSPYLLSFNDTVTYLADRLAGYDVVVSCQNVADIYPALERLHWRPPLIESGCSVAEALAGPKHLTNRYVGSSSTVRDTAATRMPGREHHSVVIASAGLAPIRRASPFSDGVTTTYLESATPVARSASQEAAEQWMALFAEVQQEHRPAAPPSLFQSFLQGGFECSSHRLRSGRRLDMLAASGHDCNATSDYRRLAADGLLTVRDGVRWHLVEQMPGTRDWSSLVPLLRAARLTGKQVIWDLLHYGLPDDVDPWAPAFPKRFAYFARDAAITITSELGGGGLYCPINEISFFAWAGGEVGYFSPFGTRRGFELKCQLARASIMAMEAILEVDPKARFVHAEPVIHIIHDALYPQARKAAASERMTQFQAWDMVSGRIWPQLGGRPELLDIIGVNYYPRNQWIHEGDRIEPNHPSHRPFHAILAETYARYGRPIFVAETGTEDEDRGPWFTAIFSEVAKARQLGIPIEGICLYPILNHPGWDNDRDCRNGLYERNPTSRELVRYEPLFANIQASSRRVRSRAFRGDPQPA